MFPPLPPSGAPNTFGMAPPGLPPGGSFPPSSGGSAPLPPDPYQDEVALLALFETLKKEATENRWVWEREWNRDLYYIANRQWISFHPARREWVDKRLQKWVPKPVTNKMAEALSAIRTNLAAIKLDLVVRPVGHDTESMAAAEIADQMSPLIQEEHDMIQVMKEADFWFIATGNACLQISWDKDERFNKVFIPNEQCLTCGQMSPPQAVVDAGQHCPFCSSNFLQKAPPDPTTGQPSGTFVAFGKGKTTALSPFEWACNPSVTRFDELPYIIRLRWRDKSYYETNMPTLVSQMVFDKAPSDRSLQIFKALALSNDIGTGSTYMSGAAGNGSEGITEYELWLRPTLTYPQGLVLRVAGDKSPLLLKVEKEAIPGPLPYTDVEGNPLFPFVHAQYEHMGGRLYGRSAISPLIQKQDQLNQLDSLIQLGVQRMANPVWIIPENAGIENLTGEPGLIVKWNTLAAGGQAKPERIPGLEIPTSMFEYRAQILKDIEDLSGAFDIIKGEKPSGIAAFSALQLLVERSQSRFTSAYQSRGQMYRTWYSLALELERQFGPQQRTWAVIGPNRGYTFQHFQNAQLQSQVTMQIEDGSNMPKTSLGKRAAIEQANQLLLLDPHDPDQKLALLSTFGLADLVPSLNIHVQAALQIQDAFEAWSENPQGLPPLVVKPWFDPQIHFIERVKWLNSDKMRELLLKYPMLEPIIIQHLQELQMLMMPAVDPATGQPLAPGAPGASNGAPGGPPTGPNAPGGGQAMTQSNKQSGATSSLPKGNAQHGNKVGPA